MPLPINVQFNIVLYSILSGILIGVLYDLYNIVRGAKVPKIIIMVEDILFWIFTSLAVFTFLLYMNYAFLNPYVYVFMIVTLVIYLKFISPMVLKIELYLISVFGKAIRIVFKTVIYPVKVIFYSISGKK
ncbi:spore cortex biosynthesis protein YabQ [Clostridium sartagoforme]|uniref:Spore cortex biosynthesis protein YabQ n=1 Tax=Clostridium sartagoforme TaxID=84031 RepID=A0A4S2DEH6_9CLOT|nr:MULTISPECIES: spore cortex biosynthesis protein YabQ [Clostridium]MBS5939568.1 spore cortex biosynthesis protein YabQ [Clostridium sp.]TGY40368.1 spore cortex biosynthesis protein YabQ [Clostridium sartagoforme]